MPSSSQGNVIALTAADFHNVDIATVEIVNPEPGTVVKFQENQENVSSLPDGEESVGKKSSSNPAPSGDTSGGAVKHRGSAASSGRRRSVHTPGNRSVNTPAHRSINTPQSRHSAYRRTPQYYEVAPGVIIPDRPITTANRGGNHSDYVGKRAYMCRWEIDICTAKMAKLYNKRLPLT